MGDPGMVRVPRRAVVVTASAIVAAAAAIGAEATLGGGSAQPAPRPRTATPTPSHHARPVAVDAGAFAPTLTPSSGPAGTVVTVRGAIPQLGEAGKPVDLTGLPVWWNLTTRYPSQAVRFPVPAGPGPLIRLVKIGLTRGQATYTASFSVPAVKDGSFPVVVLQETADGGVASLGSAVFTVTGTS